MKQYLGVSRASCVVASLLGGIVQPAPSPPSAAPAVAGRPATDASVPSDNLRVLDRLAGRWKMDVTLFVQGKPSVQLAGTSENAWIIGGRFLQCASSAGEGDARSDAVMTFGYDQRGGEYFAVAVSTSATPYLSLHGPYYDASRSFVLRGEDTTSVGIRFKRRYVIRFTGTDRYVIEGFLEYPRANPVQQFEIVYTRS